MDQPVTVATSSRDKDHGVLHASEVRNMEEGRIIFSPRVRRACRAGGFCDKPVSGAKQ